MAPALCSSGVKVSSVEGPSTGSHLWGLEWQGTRALGQGPGLPPAHPFHSPLRLQTLLPLLQLYLPPPSLFLPSSPGPLATSPQDFIFPSAALEGQRPSLHPFLPCLPGLRPKASPSGSAPQPSSLLPSSHFQGVQWGTRPDRSGQRSLGVLPKAAEPPTCCVVSPLKRPVRKLSCLCSSPQSATCYLCIFRQVT